MREAIIREIAVQSLSRSCDFEALSPDLIRDARNEGITIFEVIRERLLLKAGIASIGALMALPARIVESTPHRVATEVRRRAA